MSARPWPFPRHTFEAWKIGANGVAYPLTDRIADGAETALCVGAQFATEAHYGAIIVVKTVDSVSQDVTIATFRIRRGAWKGRYSPQLRKEYPHKAELLHTMKVRAFEPVEPFRWSPGADIVGAGDGVIEQVPA